MLGQQRWPNRNGSVELLQIFQNLPNRIFLARRRILPCIDVAFLGVFPELKLVCHPRFLGCTQGAAARIHRLPAA